MDLRCYGVRILKPAKLSTKNVLIVCAAAAVASSMFIPRGRPKAPLPIPSLTSTQRSARDISNVETIAFEVDTDGNVLGGIIVPAIWTPQDAQAHCKALNSYIIWKADVTTPQPGRGWKYDGAKIVPIRPYSTWTLDEQKLQWIADVPKPADASPLKVYGYKLPNVQLGETKGSWTTDPQKISPSDSGPPLPPQTFPKSSKVAQRWSSLRECSLNSAWNQIHCTVSAEWVCVAGGGGGSSGGGGGGGLLDGTGANALTITSTTGYTVTIGAGGAKGNGSDSGGTDGTVGSNSVFNTGTAVGGGYGRPATVTPAGDGGSGGGASASGGTATAGSATQGNSGGATGYGFAGGVNVGGGQFPSAGGGGAGAVGGTCANNSTGGVGGAGKTFFGASNASTDYAGGGGGGIYLVGTPGAGGTGGGGAGSQNSANATNGTANTGGGGGGAGGPANGGDGGSGIVMVRTASSDAVTHSGGTQSSGGGFDVSRFTTSGTWTPTFGGVDHSKDFFNMFGVRQQFDLWNRTYLRAA